MIEFNGESKSPTEWARQIGLNKGDVIVKRLKRGWTVEQALTLKPNTDLKKKKTSGSFKPLNIELNGVTKTITEWARERGYKDASIIHQRLRRGWPIEEALVPLSKPKEVKPGQRFGLLTTVSLGNLPDKKSWVCLCDCGKSHTAREYHLRIGSILSCGCLRKRKFLERSTSHGMSKTKTYQVWHDMIARCENPSHQSYKNYGGRGISVCERWHDIQLFEQDMGDPPPGMWIERVDNDAGYFPENCKWASRDEQMLNRRTSRLLVFRGRRLTLSQWANELKIDASTLSKRLKRVSWDVEKAFAPYLQRLSAQPEFMHLRRKTE